MVPMSSASLRFRALTHAESAVRTARSPNSWENICLGWFLQADRYAAWLYHQPEDQLTWKLGPQLSFRGAEVYVWLLEERESVVPVFAVFALQGINVLRTRFISVLTHCPFI